LLRVASETVLTNAEAAQRLHVARTDLVLLSHRFISLLAEGDANTVVQAVNLLPFVDVADLRDSSGRNLLHGCAFAPERAVATVQQLTHLVHAPWATLARANDACGLSPIDIADRIQHPDVAQALRDVL
jgi:hypothetical protein